MSCVSKTCALCLAHPKQTLFLDEPYGPLSRTRDLHFLPAELKRNLRSWSFGLMIFNLHG